MGTGAFRPRETQTAQRLRKAATPAERTLWAHLSSRQCEGHKFSRQMPIGPYVVDFLCRERALIVELDGYSHDLTIERDRIRSNWLEEQGYRIVRFSNADVRESLEGVLITIASALRTLPDAHPRPLPQAGGELPAP